MGLIAIGLFFAQGGCSKTGPDQAQQGLPCVAEVTGGSFLKPKILWFFTDKELNESESAVTIMLLNDRLRQGPLAVAVPDRRKVYFLKSEGGMLLATATLPPTSDLNIPGSADLDGDGELELVVVTGERGVALTSRGGKRWDLSFSTARLTRSSSQSPLLVDLNGDQSPEIIAFMNFPSPSSDGIIVIEGRTGQILWSYRDPDLNVFADFLDLGLIKGEGKDGEALVFLFTPLYLVVLSGATGSLILRTPLPYPPVEVKTPISRATYSPYSLPLLGSLGWEGEFGIALAATASVDFYPLPLTRTSDGSVPYASLLELPPISSFPSYARFHILDLNGDGHLEMIRQGNRSLTTYFFENRLYPEGSFLWISEDLENPLQGVIPALMEPAFADLNGDGIVDLLVYAIPSRDSEPSLVALNGWDGSELFSLRCVLSPFFALGDLDGDGILDLAYSGYGEVQGMKVRGVMALSLGVPFPPPDRIPWPRFGHDLRHSRTLGHGPLPP